MSSADDYLSQLHQLISNHFSQDELRTLCFHLNIDFEEFGNGGKLAKVRELLLHLARAGQMSDLIDSLRQNRPQVSWPNLPHGLEVVFLMISGVIAIFATF